ncbi:MAG: hypothetical protein JSR16_02950, partial [Proteobacteria bacterium]|nr:hypothetical protein [Pseudomonadota bacterium]
MNSSTPLAQAVSAMFEPYGALARAVDGFQPRAGQAELAPSVARVME